MASVRMDITDGTSARYTKDGWELTRVATVSELSGNAEARMIAAVDAVISAVGDIGTAHPSESSAKIVEFQPEPMAGTKAKVRIIYRTPDQEIDDPENARIVVGTSLSQAETNKDVDGVCIKLSYTYPEDYHDENKRGMTFPQGGMVPKNIPRTTLQIVMRESASPGEKSRTYTGMVNAADWSIDPSAPARTWMIMGISGDSDDGGASYTVTYQFEYRPNTWDETAVFINPDDGKPPPDITDDEGNILQEDAMKTIQIYEEVDFDTVLGT